MYWFMISIKSAIYCSKIGQDGYHHRTELNKRIYRIGKSALEYNDNATTEADAIVKNITLMGGFRHYGIIKNDYVMIKRGCIGEKNFNVKRPHLINYDY